MTTTVNYQSDLAGGGFNLGPETNVFSGSTRAEAIAARDNFETNNPAWLAEYNDDKSYNIVIEYLLNGDILVEYQRRNTAGDDWARNTSVIARKGTAGKDGSGTDFSHLPANSIPAIGPNNLPIDSGLSLIKGRDLKTSGSLELGPSSILLGPNLRISNGVSVISFKLADGTDAIGINTPYDENGSKGPFYYHFSQRDTLEVCTETTTTLFSPFELQYQTFGDNLTYDFMFIPETIGDFRVRFWMGASALDDQLIFDEIREVTQDEVDAGLPVRFNVGNKYILPQSTNLFVRFEGISLKGGVVPSGPFAGQTLPYFVSEIHPYKIVPLATFGFVDCNNSGPDQNLSANTWTTLLNDCQGPSSNSDYLPIGVDSLVDPVTGRLDFSQLSVGDEVIIRHTLSITPNSNGQTFQLRHFVGQSGQQYGLPVNIPAKMEQGGGVSTEPFTITDVIYIGNENTRIGGALPQLKVNGSSSVTYHGVYIGVHKRGVL